jgi:hypothetical protein
MSENPLADLVALFTIKKKLDLKKHCRSVTIRTDWHFFYFDQRDLCRSEQSLGRWVAYPLYQLALAESDRGIRVGGVPFRETPDARRAPHPL